jgi:3-keto-disaccharide hydrolase
MVEEGVSVAREMREWALRGQAPLAAVMILGLVAAAGRLTDAVGAGPASQPPVPPPSDAVTLFNGRDLSGWVRRGSGAPAGWKVADRVMEVVPGTGDIHTTRQFTDFQLHVEFNVPYMPNAHGQARGNSGVYLQGSYEIQVLDSFGLDSKNDDCGAVYGQTPPLVNACRPPGEWQTYDILFHAPRFDAAGQLAEKARVSVLQNNIWIQDNVSIEGPTRASMERDVHQPGPIMVQDHGSRVKYRDIWIRPLPAKAGMPKPGIGGD